jgi:hypothetical protein
MDDSEKIMLQIEALQDAGIKNDHPSMAALTKALQASQAAKMKPEEDDDEEGFADAVGKQMALMAAKKAFNSEDVEDDDKSNAMPANASTAVGEPKADVNRITSGDEKVALADLRSMLDPDLSKSALKDAPTADGGDKTPAMKANVSTMLGDADSGEPPTEMLDKLFQTAHGSAFDPKSKLDKAKMAKIQSLLATDPSLADLSPAKFALKLYTTK